MGVSRVDFGGETLVDLTGDTVTQQSLLSGYSAHNKAGELIEGLAAIPTVGNGTVTIKQNGASKGTFAMNQSGNTTIELTDNNTTYGAATQSANGLMTSADKKKLDGLTSTTSLAVTQQGMSVLDGTVGKVLDDKIAEINNKLNGCSLEQVGEDFYIVGADSVRKKLGDRNIDSDIVVIKNANDIKYNKPFNVSWPEKTIYGVMAAGVGNNASAYVMIWENLLNYISAGSNINFAVGTNSINININSYYASLSFGERFLVWLK